MAYYMYKCNAKNESHQRQWGDWDFFFESGKREWGNTTIIPALAHLLPNDTVLAYQTDRRELVGVARVVGFKGNKIIMEPLEEIRVKLPPIKKADSEIAAYSALQPGIIKTIYDMKAAEARHLLKAARASRKKKQKVKVG